LYFQRLEAEVSGGPKVAVLAVAGDVPVGSALAEQNLVIRDIPQAYVESRHVRASEIKKVVGTRVASGLKANDALFWTDLARFNDERRVLSGLVQNGMRAVPIDLRAADFDGLLRPGDRIDLLFTAGGKESGGSTTTLLQNLLVLSVGGNLSRADEKAGAAVLRSGGNVTVAATVEQAQLITQAKERGRLSLSLRNPDDITLVEGLPETTNAQVVGRVETSAPAQTKKAGQVKEGIEHVR
ncbi:MAG TPA: Flp pilus assembly protein CpaB, partial [Polyangiaceae bacterium]|nr:Flp pilus assembly protein CpaB [Polyangiaceae bacterium]